MNNIYTNPSFPFPNLYKIRQIKERVLHKRTLNINFDKNNYKLNDLINSLIHKFTKKIGIYNLLAPYGFNLNTKIFTHGTNIILSNISQDKIQKIQNLLDKDIRVNFDGYQIINSGVNFIKQKLILKYKLSDELKTLIYNINIILGYDIDYPNYIILATGKFININLINIEQEEYILSLIYSQINTFTKDDQITINFKIK